MNKFASVLLQGCLVICLTATICMTARAVNPESGTPVTFFDVANLPARIDEPRLTETDQRFVLDCAVANRSGEAVLGLRLVLLVIDSAGRVRSRTTWTERAELPMYSIRTFAFHPELNANPRVTDKFFLSIDEVIGREMIWRVIDAEKALGAYAHGQSDAIPAVRTVANQFDPRADAMKVIFR